MEKLRSPLPVLPWREDAWRDLPGNELVRADLSAGVGRFDRNGRHRQEPGRGPTRKQFVLPLTGPRAFWRDPRLRFVVIGARDFQDAIEAAEVFADRDRPDGYELRRIESRAFDAASLVVTFHYRVDTFGAK